MNRFPTGVACLLVMAGCTEEVKRFDANLIITRADAVADGVIQYSYVDNLGIGDGSGVKQVQGLRVGIDATSIQFTVETVGAATPGLGRSAMLPIVDGQTLDVHVLLAPLNTIGQIQDTPKNLGGDACIAADGEGNLFMLGGSEADEAGYIYTNTLALRSFGPGVLKGVSGLGCAAFNGAVAAVGGCNTSVDAVQLIQGDGTLTEFQVDLQDACGALAAPTTDGGVWVVDGTGAVTLHDAEKNIVFNADVDGEPEALEVTPSGNLVVLAGGSARHVSPDGVKRLSPATALARRGNDLFILDQDEVKRLNEAKAPESLGRGIPVGSRFTVLSDDTVVALVGTTVTVVKPDNTTSTLQAEREHTTIVTLPGDTVLLLGALADGFDGFSLR